MSGKADQQIASIIREPRKITPLRKPLQCPNCKNMSSRKSYPFCSKRCADVDLGRWFNGTYTIDQ
ncbi:MAG: DNA gyrase inhibitor YacG [Hyphomicrobiales bacterium]|nr:DNA gyrase inhibitor YacG [Hyphomicrobiales bacterium]